MPAATYGSHEPVLLSEVLEQLGLQKGDVCVDGTLGAGGYTARLLQEVGNTGTVISFDLDPDAIAHAQERFQAEIGGERLHLVRASFAQMHQKLGELGITTVQGVVLDLGLSTHQLTTAQRGFSFGDGDAPLNMRFDAGASPASPTAATLLQKEKEEGLADLFYTYGELRNARLLANLLVERRSHKPLSTVRDLTEVAMEAKKGPEKREAYLAKVFQALRIATNDELEALATGLRQGIDLLATGKRIAVVSYHSLEDRIVKQVFRDEATSCVCPEESPVCTCDALAHVRVLTTKPVIPSEDEIQTNRKARSAKLRVAERLQT